MYFFIGVRCRVPKLTFTSVVDLPQNSPYMEKYIKVTWCLYPHVPDKIKKSYVQISNRQISNDRRYFEILNHKTCQCRVSNKSTSTAGYEELRKSNIRELINIPNNGKSTSPSIKWLDYFLPKSNFLRSSFIYLVLNTILVICS